MITKKHYIVGTVTALALLSLFFVRPYTPRTTTDVPEKAAQLGQWIDEQSGAYQLQESRIAALQTQIDALTADLSMAEFKRTQAANVAKGHRYALCEQFNLLRVEGGFAEAKDCVSFQEQATGS